MTDAEIRDAAVVELKKTTQGYLKSNGQPRPLVGVQWQKGLDLLAQIGAAPPPPTAPALVSSSIVAGQTLQGVMAWAVVTSGSVAKVEFWANGGKLGEVVSAPYTFLLDTMRLPEDANSLGLAIVGVDGSRLTPQIGTVTVDNVSAPPPSSGISFRADFDPNGWPDGYIGQAPLVASSIDGYAARQGTNFARFRTGTTGGDGYSRNLGHWMGYRNGNPLDAQVGSHFFYAWSHLLPTQPSYPNTGLIVHEVHGPASLAGAAGGLQAPLKIVFWGGPLMQLRLLTGQISIVNGNANYAYREDIDILKPPPYGKWIDLIVEILWHPQSGTLRLWRRVEGETSYTLVADRPGIPTMFRLPDGSVPDHYWLQGIYTSHNPPLVNTIYSDGFRRGATFADVAA